jgi:hypothetical protein
VKRRDPKDSDMPPHLAVWPRHDDPGFEEWYAERWAWGEAHGESKLEMLRERFRRKKAEMEPVYAAYRKKHGIPDDWDGAA